MVAGGGSRTGGGRDYPSEEFCVGFQLATGGLKTDRGKGE